MSWYGSFCSIFFRLFFFNDTATTEIYTLSLHDALPIFGRERRAAAGRLRAHAVCGPGASQARVRWRDRKSTRLNSSHSQISYAVFCLKKKKKKKKKTNTKKTTQNKQPTNIIITNTHAHH